MNWPERPTCHTVDVSPFARAEHMVWRPPDTGIRELPYRTCGYCGSIHPEDLLTVLQSGAELGGSDWKYGWPHKFYLRVPNPNRDAITEVGSSSSVEDGKRVETPIMGRAGDFHAKWYNQHLNDEGYSEAARRALLEALARHSGIVFSFDAEGRLMYRAPYHGYQR